MTEKRRDAWNFGYSMSKILGINTPSGKNIPVWKLENPERRIITIDELRKTEMSWDFIECCLALMIPGAFRYGRLNASGKPQFDRISDSIKRLERYKDDHNLLHLFDSNNLNMLEFEEGRHPDRHFRNEDDVIHTEKIK